MAMSLFIRKTVGFRAISSPMILTYKIVRSRSEDQFVRFSTASINQLFLQVLDSQIQSATPSLPTEPIDFPFETKLEHGGGVTLKREILGEKIEVWAYLEDENANFFSLSVTISKQNGSSLSIWINASADDIIVKSMSYGPPVFGSVCGYKLKMPSFEAQQGLKNFLEIRGINTNNAKLLRKYLTQNSNNSKILYLCKLKKFLTDL